MKYKSYLSKIVAPQKGVNALQDWRDEIFPKVIKAIGYAGTILYIISFFFTYEEISEKVLFFSITKLSIAVKA